MIIIGIDNGHKGGIAFLSDKRTIEAIPMPTMITKLKGGKKKTFIDLEEIRNIFLQFRGIQAIAYVEKAQVMPLRDKSSIWVAARAYSTYFLESGMILGLLIGLGISYEIILPQVWQKRVFGTRKRGSDTKKTSIITAKRNYPGVNLLPTPRCKKESDGMADAVNIAHYGLLQQRAKEQNEIG